MANMVVIWTRLELVGFRELGNSRSRARRRNSGVLACAPRSQPLLRSIAIRWKGEALIPDIRGARRAGKQATLECLKYVRTFRLRDTESDDLLPWSHWNGIVLHRALRCGERKSDRVGGRRGRGLVVPDPPLYTVTLQFLLELSSAGCLASSDCTVTVRQQKEEPSLKPLC